jgi:hypothetical protein
LRQSGINGNVLREKLNREGRVQIPKALLSEIMEQQIDYQIEEQFPTVLK